MSALGAMLTGPALVTPRFAEAPTVVVSDAELFAGVGSVVVAETVAVFVIEPLKAPLIV
jgi:hypothetical protein